MNIRSISLSSSLFVLVVGVLGGCAVPADEGTSSVDPTIDDSVSIASGGHGGNDDRNSPSNNGPQTKRWTWWYAQAVAAARAQATAVNGGTATATATAFADSLRRNGKHNEPCAANAIAVATAVAEVSCNGATTVATAVASVLTC